METDSRIETARRRLRQARRGAVTAAAGLFLVALVAARATHPATAHPVTVQPATAHPQTAGQPSSAEDDDDADGDFWGDDDGDGGGGGSFGSSTAAPQVQSGGS